MSASKIFLTCYAFSSLFVLAGLHGRFTHAVLEEFFSSLAILEILDPGSGHPLRADAMDIAGVVNDVHVGQRLPLRHSLTREELSWLFEPLEVSTAM